VGIIIFFSIFSFVGTAIFLKTSYNPRKMGILSSIIGFFLEFTIMKPEWVQNIFALKIGGDVIGAIIVSPLYWFMTWGHHHTSSIKYSENIRQNKIKGLLTMFYCQLTLRAD